MTIYVYIQHYFTEHYNTIIYSASPSCLHTGHGDRFRITLPLVPLRRGDDLYVAVRATRKLWAREYAIVILSEVETVRTNRWCTCSGGGVPVGVRYNMYRRRAQSTSDRRAYIINIRGV